MPRTESQDQYDNFRAHIDVCSDCKRLGWQKCDQGTRAWTRYLRAKKKERG